MTSFYVNHGAHEEITNLLSTACGNMGTILDSLNGHIQRMNEATSGQAVPIWAEHQTNWNNSYTDMHGNLNSGTNAAINIGETFRDGDRRGAQIML